ncbi:hypothetical protein KIN20_006069 [Parelaphostrongylus tenuis]|uniref:Uncharacterized protein n=1 Tax=Parelaphostrongylus tenuis TaxID=148309 RepID=A0AAD5QKP6_PARTN|nr:hypothetical protein KIN20_006069 [Parelaphostrongylus tenuis]
MQAFAGRRLDAFLPERMRLAMKDVERGRDESSMGQNQGYKVYVVPSSNPVSPNVASRFHTVAPSAALKNGDAESFRRCPRTAGAIRRTEEEHFDKCYRTPVPWTLNKYGEQHKGEEKKQSNVGRFRGI